jgi:hypothetical protein
MAAQILACGSPVRTGHFHAGWGKPAWRRLATFRAPAKAGAHDPAARPFRPGLLPAQEHDSALTKNRKIRAAAGPSPAHSNDISKAIP